MNPPARSQSLSIRSIRCNGGTQPRGQIDEATVAEYRQAMEAGTEFPAVVVFFDGSDHWLADGFHRVLAAGGAGRTEIACEVRTGTREDAVWYSCGANKAHGLKRTNADKRRAVETALRLRAGESDRAIAEHVGVDHTTVARVRSEIAPAPAQLVDSTSSRKGRDGKTRATAPEKQAKGGAASATKRADEKKAREPATKQPPQPAAEKNGKGTSPLAEATARAEQVEHARGELHRDGLGRVLPDDIADDFRRVKDLYAKLDSALDAAIRAAGEIHKEPWRGATTARRQREAFQQERLEARQQAPFTTCPYCKLVAALRPRCQFCSGCGFVGEREFKAAAPELQITGADAVVMQGGAFVRVREIAA